MTFEEWFSEKHGDYNLEEESGWYARYGWEACKNEVIKIIIHEENINGICQKSCHGRLLARIEKL